MYVCFTLLHIYLAQDVVLVWFVNSTLFALPPVDIWRQRHLARHESCTKPWVGVSRWVQEQKGDGTLDC